MTKTIIIVEDDNDKHTFEAIIRYFNLSEQINVSITPPLIEWKSVQDERNTEKPTALIRALVGLRNDFNKEKYDKVGIIRDMDDRTKEERISLINNALKEAYPDEVNAEIEDVNSLLPITFIQNSTENELTIRFACHFVNLNGQGEIEDILKAIKKLPSEIADCIDAHLPECLRNDDEKLRDKELVKLWINHYLRYDTLTKADRNSNYTKWENVMKYRAEDLFDFQQEIPELQALVSFLRLLVS
ncbi:DUF3226 domain-containing protein [Arcicella lustrica]|uniref:DUF3226 domain-containing protein n=1 Tax=Arcicella lustrica TaxID=2984196 RepID=A0ABU5SCK0_9BACT|nr:DUF3226 domain-containing protein [Arcicella sp. DC25W]MEA5425022.1 DUF3226 domain-containing protein [Arcicella sp. DC25W]